MSKKLSSTLLLFAIGIGFGIYSVTSLIQAIHAKQTDMVIQALLYMIPSVAAFGALILLPFKRE
jgi:hypothetical protein